MEPDNYELSDSEINHELLTSIRSAIEQSNHQIESLSYELVGNLSEIAKLLEEQKKSQTNNTELENTLYSIEKEISEISKGIDGITENYRTCTNDMLSALMKINEHQAVPRNYHPWFLIITILISLGLIF